MTNADLRYIQQRGTTYRVRFPEGIWPGRWFATCPTLKEAQEVRDAHLSSIGRNHSAPNNSTFSLADITIPANKYHRRLDEEKALVVPHANVLVVNDLHVPHHNTELLQRAIFITKKYFPWIEDIIFGGDTWDFNAISRHPKDQPTEDIGESLALGGEVIRSVCSHFAHAWFTNGNHDERVGHKLDAPWTLEHTISAALGKNWPAHCELHITNFDYVFVNSEDGDSSKNWIVGHPSHYSGQGGKTPADIADIEGRNVATGHNHVIGMAGSKSGKWLGVDVGHMTNPDKHYYVRRRLTRFTRWQAGFLIISDGRPYHFAERWVDWSRWGC